VSGLWGWDGWIVVALIPLAFLALIATFVILVFHQEGASLIDLFDDTMTDEGLDDSALDDSALGWRPSVPSNDERPTGTRPRPPGPREPRSGRS
jgi:hypothetical protein